MIGVFLAASAGLVVSLSIPRHCLPLESVPIVVTWEATEDLAAVQVAGDSRSLPLGVSFEIEGTGGRYGYVESQRSEVYGSEPWPRGTRRRQLLVLSYGRVGSPVNRPGYLFSSAGNYRVRMHYRDDATGLTAASAWKPISVEEPTDEGDMAVLAGLRQGQAGGALRGAYPRSRYFSYLRMEDLGGRSVRIKNGQDPDSHARVPLTGEALDAWKTARYEELSTEFEAEAERSEVFAREALVKARMATDSPGRQQALERRLDASWPGWRELPDLP